MGIYIERDDRILHFNTDKGIENSIEILLKRLDVGYSRTHKGYEITYKAKEDRK